VTPQGIPEMRALKNIDVAFVCMNLPYMTMDINEAFDAVLAFKPRIVVSYHYRVRAVSATSLPSRPRSKAATKHRGPPAELVSRKRKNSTARCRAIKRGRENVHQIGPILHFRRSS